MRYTIKHVRSRFSLLIEALGKKDATSCNYEDGSWYIREYQNTYSIVKVVGTGYADVFSADMGYTARELCLAINFALRAIQIDRDDKACHYWPKAKGEACK